MRRGIEVVLAALAAAGIAVFAWGAAGTGASVRGGAASVSYFHGGKDAARPAADPACQDGKCHAGLPHRKPVPESAFRNMHVAFAECLACHGKDPEGRWAPAGGAGGRRIRFTGGAAAADRHEGTARALSCRSCHSEAGREALRRKGIQDLPNNFASPIALRMIEEKGKRWVPDEIR